MIRKYLSLVLVGLMLYGGITQTAVAQPNTDKELEKVKTEIRKRGTGKESKVVVTMKDGTKLNGYISQILEDSFDLTDAKTKQPNTIPYRDMAQVKRLGMSKGAKTAITIGVVAGIAVLVLTLPGKGPLSGICPLGC